MRKIKKSRNRKDFYVLNAKKVADSLRRNRWQLLITMAGCFLLVFFGMNLKSFLFASEYFKVSEIEVVDQDEDKIDYPVARIKDNPNIFSLDLDRIAENIEEEYPDIQQVTVRRVLPNKLFIEILRRRPIVQLEVSGTGKGENRNYYYYTANRESYILENKGMKPQRNLPIVSKTGISRSDVQMGKVCENINLSSALELVEQVKRINFFDNYRITQISVDSPPNMAFYLNDKLEIRIGNRKLQEKLENLAGILQSKDIDYTKDYYVDLRFKDLVFGKK